ncbi:hypothetical protein FJZ28_05090 [Candidatus Peregrinibacteria bacterium]|nr:hypothetical protein [Candidatus Peregrinibacteria bacterium]
MSANNQRLESATDGDMPSAVGMSPALQIDSSSVQSKINLLTHTTNRDTQQPFSESLRRAYEQVAAQGEFALVDLPFSESEATVLRNLHVPGDTDWGHFGSIDDLHEKLAQYFERFTDDESLRGLCSTRITDIAREALSALGKDAAWVCIRSMEAAEGRPPRWHSDGKFFARAKSNEPQMKLAFCLCGESTHFAKLDAEGRTRFNEIQRNSGTQDQLNASVPTSSIVTPVTTLQGGLFAVGSDMAAIHSEPPMTVPRIFVSIVPGTLAEVKELQQRWNA